KERSRPLRVRALVITIGLNLPKKILEAQTEALKPENLSAEDVGGVGYRAVNNATKKKIPNQPSTHFNPRGRRLKQLLEMNEKGFTGLKVLSDSCAGLKRWRILSKLVNVRSEEERFNELALLCLDAVPNEKKKVELYIKGLPEIIKGETTSSRPVTFNEAVRMAHALMEQKIQAKNERIAEGLKRKWENNNQDNNNNNHHNRGNYQNNNHHNQNNNQTQKNVRALTTAQNTGANQTGVTPKCNRCGRCHFYQCPQKCENCGRIGHKAKDCRGKNVAPGAAVQPNIVCYRCGERVHKSSECSKKADRRVGNVQGQTYVIRDAKHNQGPNVVT
nr:hypothetical protein [Tanacetum cinerariifolium]